MYSKCLFCHADLGRNDALEVFPVGRRLAFDAAHGRLWVVCRKCERWNLTPLEERWEAIDACERLYRGTRTRVATDQIGLARLPDRTELVRIGKPLRPEFAAWRYGDQFGRRRVRHVGMAAGGVAFSVLAMWGLPTLGVFAGIAGSLAQTVYSLNTAFSQNRRVVACVALEDGRALSLTRRHVGLTSLEPVPETGGWVLRVAHRAEGNWLREGEAETVLSDDAARRAAAVILPQVNVGGASRRRVREAVDVLESHGAGDPGPLFAAAARMKGSTLSGHETLLRRVGFLPEPMRLALEMASHEEQERRAMDGELALLEAAWKDAEALAKIADSL